MSYIIIFDLLKGCLDQRNCCFYNFFTSHREPFANVHSSISAEVNCANICSNTYLCDNVSTFLRVSRSSTVFCSYKERIEQLLEVFSGRLHFWSTKFLVDFFLLFLAMKNVWAQKFYKFDEKSYAMKHFTSENRNF